MRCLVLMIMLLMSNPVFAATLYFKAGGVDSNWSTLGNWSTTSSAGASNAAAIPTAADDVILDAGSPNCILNTATAKLAKTFTTTAYTNTMTFNVALTVSGNVSLCSACTIAGTSGMTVNAAATLTSNGKTFPNTLSVYGLFVFTLADNWTVGGLTAANNASTLNGNTIYINGGLTLAGNLAIGTTNLVLQGTGTWSGTNPVGNNLTINTPGGTITLGATVAFGATGKTLTYTAGTVVVTGSTFYWNGGTLDTSGMTWNNLMIPALNITDTLNSNLNVAGNLSTAITSQGTAINGYTIYIGGNINLNTMTSGVISGTTNLVMTSSTINSVAFSGTGTISMSSISSGLLKNNLEINTTGTITLSGTINYSTGIFKYTAGTVTATGSTLVLSTAGVTLTTNHSGLTLNAVTTSANTTFNGSSGFTMASLSDTTAGTTLTFGASNTYTVSTTLTLAGSKASPMALVSGTGGTQVVFTLSNGATFEAAFANATDMDSSHGITIWSFAGVLSNTTNWRSFLHPPTVAYTY